MLTGAGQEASAVGGGGALWTIEVGGDGGDRRGYAPGDPLLGPLRLWSHRNKQAHHCKRFFLLFFP